MKKPSTEIFGENGGKWTAVSAKIRNLYDSVLKESVPQNLKASSQLTSAPSREAMERQRTPEAAVHIPPVVTETGPSVRVTTPKNIEQGEINSPLPDQNNSKNDSRKS